MHEKIEEYINNGYTFKIKKVVIYDPKVVSYIASVENVKGKYCGISSTVDKAIIALATYLMDKYWDYNNE